MEVRTFQEKLHATSANGLPEHTSHDNGNNTSGATPLAKTEDLVRFGETKHCRESTYRKQSEQKQHHDNKAWNRSFSTQHDVYVRNFGTGPN